LVSLFPVITTALASLVNIYVAALNTPGVVPNVQSAWETFVHKKCTEAKCAAVQVYDKAMSTQLDKCQLPCDSDDIRKMQKNAVEESMAVFQEEIVGISALSSEKYLVGVGGVRGGKTQVNAGTQQRTHQRGMRYSSKTPQKREIGSDPCTTVY